MKKFAEMEKFTEDQLFELTKECVRLQGAKKGVPSITNNKYLFRKYARTYNELKEMNENMESLDLQDE